MEVRNLPPEPNISAVCTVPQEEEEAIMAEVLSLYGRKERLSDATDLTTDELRTHQQELEAQLAVAQERRIVRWQETIPPMLARIALELSMRTDEELDVYDRELAEPALAGV